MVFYGVFAGEGGLNAVKISAAVSTLGVILTAAYMLWMNQRVFYGEIKEKWLKMADARKSELLVLGVLLSLSLVYGLYPKFISNLFVPQLDQLAYYSSKLAA